MVPIVKTGTTQCKRIYILLIMFIIASLILYILTFIGKDDGKIKNPIDVLFNRRRWEDTLEAHFGEVKENFINAEIVTIESEGVVERIKKEQERRKSKMRQACKISPYLKDQNLLYFDTLLHLYVIEKEKLLFCYIPKVGCSNWKRLLMVLAGRKQATDGITSLEAHAYNGLVLFGSLSTSEQSEKLMNYRKVMFVREPFTRIISAFKNKYQDLSVFHAAPYNLKEYARHIMKKYRANATREDLVTGENITWAEFTDYLADPSEWPQFDEHWKESFKLCSPCKIKYDFIGKLENMEEEANFVLQNFNFTKQLQYPSANNSHPTGSAATNISKYFDNFSQTKIQTLWNIYRTDYELFGYPKPAFIH